jgi:Cu/Zn superoxide dismutase
MKVSIKGSGWKSYKPREPVKTVTSYQLNNLREPVPAYNNKSPSLDEIQHVWEEGSKRPKTQNEKSRRKNETQAHFESTEIFPFKNTSPNKLYDIPIIVVRDDKNRRVVSAKRDISSKQGIRPSTFKPIKSSLISSLDKDFLDLFQT